MTGPDIAAQLARCDREIAELDALPEDVNAKAVDIAMARHDWELEKRLIEEGGK